jgi:hypothetical protein
VPIEEVLRERALAGDQEAAYELALRLRDADDPDSLVELKELATSTRLPQVIGVLLAGSHLTGDVEGLREWAADSDLARELLPAAVANRERYAQIAARAAVGDVKAGLELAVRMWLARDRAGLRRLVAAGNPVAAVQLCDIAFWDDDIDTLRDLARTGLAACVSNFALMADDDELEQLAAAGSITAFQHRCHQLINAGDSAGLQAFLDALPTQLRLQ